MNHLTPSEFVDYLEGTLGGKRAAHVAACSACQGEAAALRRTLDDASSVYAPEPSPLFWDHFGARVREEIATAPDRTPWGRGRLRPLVAAAAAALLVAFVFARGPLRTAPVRTPEPVLDVSTGKVLVPDREGAAIATDTAEPDDQVWSLLEDAAGDLQLEEARAAGLSVRPGAVDRAVQDLSPRERAELGRLLAEEIRQTERPSRRTVKELS